MFKQLNARYGMWELEFNQFRVGYDNICPTECISII